jgi:hypothetical protein
MLSVSESVLTTSPLDFVLASKVDLNLGGEVAEEEAIELVALLMLLLVSLCPKPPRTFRLGFALLLPLLVGAIRARLDDFDGRIGVVIIEASWGFEFFAVTTE